MSELIVFGFSSPQGADEARTDLLYIDKEYLADVGDATIATVDSNGAIQLNQMVNLWTVSPGGSPLWRLMVGLLFLQPLLGVLKPSTARGVSEALIGCGINEAFMKDMSTMLQPGAAVLFILSSESASGRVIDQVKPHAATQLRTRFDNSKESQLHVALELAHTEAKQHRASINGVILG